ncbi:MAG: hypothetical protein WD607_00890 [Candidatus Paceibacterota bacterium]
MKKVMKISLVLSIMLLAAINFSQFDNSPKGDVKLAALFNVAFADDESGSCCTAFTVNDHCGMKKKFINGAFCCESASACDMCTMSTYKSC